MHRIFQECDFFNFCNDQGFQKKEFFDHLYNLKEKGLKREVENNRILKEGFFSETLLLLGSLVHGKKYKTDPVYKKESPKKNKKVRFSYTAKDAYSVFKRYPYLDDLVFLEQLSLSVYKEKCIQYVLENRSYRIKNNIKFRDYKFLFDFIKNLDPDHYERFVIQYQMGSYTVEKDGHALFIIDKDLMLKFKNMGIFKSNRVDSLHIITLDISKDFKEKCVAVNKKDIKNKISDFIKMGQSS